TRASSLETPCLMKICSQKCRRSFSEILTCSLSGGTVINCQRAERNDRVLIILIARTRYQPPYFVLPPNHHSIRDIQRCQHQSQRRLGICYESTSWRSSTRRRLFVGLVCSAILYAGIGTVRVEW